MRTLLSLLLCAAPALGALSNAVTVNNLLGSDQTNRVVTIPRYFAQGEVCNYPQPYIGGSAVTYWQADVRNRWPADAGCGAGYVKFALITIERTITASSSITVEFRSSAAASSGGAGMNKAAMLAFDTGGGAGVWPSQMTVATGGISFTVSARTMISNDQYKVLENGPVRTSILVREGPDSVQGTSTRAASIGWQCTATCTVPYDTATWANNSAYYSIRPSYLVTFHRSPSGGTNSVTTDFLLDNGWMDRAQDQRIEAMTLYMDDTGSSACYTAPAVFVMPWRARMFESCGTDARSAMGESAYTSLANVTTPGTNIDFNYSYLYYSKLIHFEPEFTVPLAAETLELTATTFGFNINDQGWTVTGGSSPHMGKSQWKNYQMQSATGGSRPDIVLIPRWDARWLVRQSAGMLAVVLGNAKATFHIPIFYLDAHDGTPLATGGSGTSYGRLMSIDSHPTFVSSTACCSTTDADKPHTPAGTAMPQSGGTCAANDCMVSIGTNLKYGWWKDESTGGPIDGWGHDIAHRAGNYFGAYIATGNYIYLEGMLNEGAFVQAWGPSGVPGSWTSLYADRWNGIVFDLGDAPRSSAWGVRTLVWAATFAVDGSAEQNYFKTHLNMQWEFTRGRLNLTAADGVPRDCTGFVASTETDPWRMGRCFYENNRANPLGYYINASQQLSTCYCWTSTEVGYDYPNYQQPYVVAMLSQAKDWGWPVDSILLHQAQFAMRLIADSALGSPLWLQQYYIPETKGDRSTYINSMASMASGKGQTAILAKPIISSDTTISLLGYMDGNGNPAENVMDTNLGGNMWMQLESERLKVLSFAGGVAKTVSAVDTSGDTLTITAHGFATGETVMFIGTTLDNGMTGGTNCATNRSGVRNQNCWFWLSAVDANTIQIFTDAGLSSLVNLTGGSSGMTTAPRSVWTVASTCGTGAQTCRGRFDTTAASHAAGTVATSMQISGIASRFNDAEGGHGITYRSMLGIAVDAGASITDSVTGKTITARRALQMYDQAMPFKYEMGGTANCTGLTQIQCGDTVWAIGARQVVNNFKATVKSTSVDFVYVAPTGDACTYAVQTAAFASTDSSGDTSDGKAVRPRMVSVTGLTPGTAYNYRLTCGPGGGTTRQQGTFTTTF